MLTYQIGYYRMLYSSYVIYWDFAFVIYVFIALFMRNKIRSIILLMLISSLYMPIETRKRNDDRIWNILPLKNG